MRLHLIILLALTSLSSAWLPVEHKVLVSRDGTNLFNATTLTGRRSVKRWLPGSGAIRGVNLGSMFVFEPWIGEAEGSNMGCGNQASEFDCVLALGQSAANAAFQHHWDTWITKADIA